MPTKLNRAGNQQNYVPAGNGDASGEYGDNATGSNKHFQVFKKPEDTPVATNLTQQQKETPKPTIEVEEDKKTSSGIKYETEKGHFKWNDFWNKWIYYPQAEYERYLKQKATAEKNGYFGYSNDKWKEDDIKIIPKEETDKVFAEAKAGYDDYIDNLTIDDIKQVNDNYRNARNYIKKMLGDDFSDEEKENFLKQNREAIDNFSNNFEGKIKNQRVKVAKDYIEHNFTKIKGEHSASDDLANSNPLRDKGGVYRINCQRCPYVYELRRRGYDVQAYPNDDDYGRKKGTFWRNQMIFKEEYTFKNSIGARKLNAKIAEKVLAAGNGARFAVDVQWHRSTSGHLFIVENVNGSVRYVDSQTNNNDAISYLNNLATTKETSIMRMDNADFAEGVVMTGFSSKGE